MNDTYHIPVMLQEAMDALNIQPGGCYVDVTFGGGGHSRAILQRLGERGRLLAFDQDPDAEANLPSPPDSRLTFVRSNFRYLRNFLRYHDAGPIDGLLADLGVSSHHLDDASRGFAFRYDGPLDMRMNTRATCTAAQYLAEATEERLADTLRLYGELGNARRMARAIVEERSRQPLLTIGQLTDVVGPLLPPARRKKEMAKLFQALRMEVNHEMDALAEMLTAATRSLRPGGRLVVITYHSLEDRLVKNLMRSGNLQGVVEKDFYGEPLSPYVLPWGSKPTVPTDEEVERNPRARSAKLRVAQKRERTERRGEA